MHGGVCVDNKLPKCSRSSLDRTSGKEKLKRLKPINKVEPEMEWRVATLLGGAANAKELRSCQ